LGNIFRVDIFDPHTVECIIIPSPNSVNQDNEDGLSIKLLEGKASGKESIVTAYSFRCDGVKQQITKRL